MERRRGWLSEGAEVEVSVCGGVRLPLVADGVG